MKTYDIAVVGSGIGGSLISSLNKDKDIILFEKDTNLGGCSGSFKRFGYEFNTGATTLAGYENNHPLKRILDRAGVKLNLVQSDIAIRCIQGDKRVDRGFGFERFLKQVQESYPHPNNEKFWRKIQQIDEKFWTLKNIYFTKYSLRGYFLTSKAIFEFLKVFGFELFLSARSFIKKYFPDISKEYQNFIDAQLLITIQSTSKDVPLLSLALGLSYPFHDVYFAPKGMGSLFDDILQGVEVKKEEAIISIQKREDYFVLQSQKAEYRAKKVILNSTVYDSAKLFKDEQIKRYYEQFKFNDQSAFTLYMYVKTEAKLLHHYQIVVDKKLPNTISNSFFVSAWKQDDGYSITISTHTAAHSWLNLDKSEYKKRKLETGEYIKQEFMNYFPMIEEDDIIKYFSATSRTFLRYIGRSNCGGGGVSLKKIINLPSCRTPFEGLYNIGDTVFAGQGWPGIALGVEVLDKEINYSSK